MFILTYLKTSPVQVTHGIMFGLAEHPTRQWIYVLLLVLRTTLRQLNGTPSSRIGKLARHLDRPIIEVMEATAPPGLHS